MIIDAKDMIVGRLATFVAKKALMGEEVTIVNSEKAVITGNPKEILEEYKKKRSRGAALIGPYFPKGSERILKRIIRGMLPYKQPRGREALDRVKCYIGVPKEFEGKEKSYKEFNVSKTYANFVTLGRISKELGAKQ